MVRATFPRRYDLAIKPQDNTAFLREVDEEVRKQQTADFWRRWGKWIAAAIVAALIAFGGYIYWQHRQAQAREAEGEVLNQVLLDIEDGNLANANERLATLAQSRSPGYRAAAQLAQAALAVQTSDNAAAVRIYAAVAADASLPQPYRDLALVRQTAVEFGTIPPQQVIDRLRPLAQPGNAFFGSAGEMTAVAMMALGQNQQAGQLFAQIANDAGVPDTIKSRAVQMAGVLGVDAVPEEEQAGEGNGAPAPAAPVPAEGTGE